MNPFRNKNFLILFGIFGGCLFGGGLIYLDRRSTAQPVETQFKLIGSGRIHEAYEALSPAFRARYNEDNFKALVRAYHLDAFKEVSWGSIRSSRRIRELEGTMNSTDNFTAAIGVRMINVYGEWEIDSISGSLSPELKKSLSAGNNAK